MKSLTKLTSLYTSLSQNNSTANTTLGQQLINDQHRYLIQKFFDNEKTYTVTTIGGQTLATTASLALAATTATLTASWTLASVKQLVNFSSGDQRLVTFTNGSTAISWINGLSTTATTVITTVGVQAYPIPANVSKIINDTITVGQLKFTPAPVMTMTEWMQINALPYTSDIPNYYFIYNGNVEFWPIPSTTGNIITFNYKTRVADLTFADYSTGTVTATAGSYSLAGTATSWNTTGLFPLNTDLTFFNLMVAATPPKGDGIWYPISRFTGDTALTLALPTLNAPGTGATYTIGQFPLLQEDFHDMLVHGALMTYFSTIKQDSSQFKQFSALYSERMELLEDYAGTKSVNYDLGPTPMLRNVNQYTYAQGSVQSP